jgi:hypothetical protein
MSPRPPPSSPLFQKLTPLDPGIANRWAAATHDGKVKVTPEMMDTIIFPVLSSGQLNEKTAKAIMALVSDGNLDVPTFGALVDLVQVADEYGELTKAATPATPDDLKMIERAVDPVGLINVDFVSPLTHIHYSPAYYQVIKQLIRNGDIKVFMVKDAGLRLFANLDNGTYESSTNRLFIYDRLNNDQQRNVVVHEMTHAIQDWLDIGGMAHKFAEADAHICGGVMSRTRGQNPFAKKSPAEEAFEAAKFVIDGTATPSNKAWTTAYDKVVKVINKMPVYKKTNSKAVDNIENGNGDPKFVSEKTRFFDLLRSILPATYSPVRTRSPSKPRGTFSRAASR